MRQCLRSFVAVNKQTKHHHCRNPMEPSSSSYTPPKPFVTRSGVCAVVDVMQRLRERLARVWGATRGEK